MTLRIREKKSKATMTETPALARPDVEVDVTETVQILHQHITASLCQKIFKRVRVSERQRVWTLYLMVQFWIEVVIRAPQALTQALQECGVRGRGWPLVKSTPEAFFQRSRDLHWRFFAEVYVAFLKRALPDAPRVYGSEMAAVQDRFAEVWLLDGSRLDAVAHRLKILQPVTAVVLPGCVAAAYDLWRGIPRIMQFCPDAAKSELKRVLGLLPQIPDGVLLLGDRLYASLKLFEALKTPQRWGVFRRNGTISFKKQQCLSRRWVDGGKLEDWLVEAGSGQTAPRQTLRYIRYTRHGVVYELLTNVLDPQQLSALEAINLYGFRWSIERMFFDLKEVLNLHQFYAGSPNAVAMQVYAATIVYTALRIAQGRIAQTQGIVPEAISPAKLFPRLAASSFALTIAEHTYEAVCQANPGRRLRRPDLRQQGISKVKLGNILVETRKGTRRPRRFCRGRTRWKSFAHIRGGKKFTKLI